MGAVPLNRGEAVAAGEAGDIGGDAHDGGSHDGTDAEDVDDARSRSGDDLFEAFLVLGDLGVDAAQVVEELVRELYTGGGHGSAWFHVRQQ